ncbi:MAG: chromosomal replication initiator protein DnaA, partial [Nitrospinae bacterium RIFCSPLOWO2_02_39_17]
MKLLWNKCKEELKNRVNKSNYEIWLDPISFVSVDEKFITVSVPNKYYIDRINKDYLKLLEEIVRDIFKRDFGINLISSGETGEFTAQDSFIKKEKKERVVSTTHVTGLNQKYTFDNFIVGNCNQFAHAAAKAVAENSITYNPLFIYGDVGLGKTHLMHATGNFILNNSKKRVLYVTSEVFVNDMITSIQHSKMTSFREKYRRLDVLFVDDVHFIAGKEQSQEEFFHTFNTLFELHKQIVLSSDKYPREIPRLVERLKSRFEWGLIADIQPPELETRIAILKRKAE